MQPSDDSPAPGQRWVPMVEAERILGRPEATIRRWIREGRVIGEQVPRNPDNPRDSRLVWQVLVTDAPGAATPSESDQSAAGVSEPSADATLALEMTQAQTRQIEAQAETIREKDEQIAELYGRIAALEREAGEASARADSLQAQLEAERERRERAERPWWRRLLAP